MTQALIHSIPLIKTNIHKLNIGIQLKIESLNKKMY